MNELPVLTIGAKKLSTNADPLSVGLSLAETIGLPGTGVTFLSTLGSRYSLAVQGSLVTRNLATRSVISPRLSMLSS